jgi:hypothetical protein
MLEEELGKSPYELIYVYTLLNPEQTTISSVEVAKLIAKATSKTSVTPYHHFKPLLANMTDRMITFE